MVVYKVSTAKEDYPLFHQMEKKLQFDNFVIEIYKTYTTDAFKKNMVELTGLLFYNDSLIHECKYYALNKDEGIEYLVKEFKIKSIIFNTIKNNNRDNKINYLNILYWVADKDLYIAKKEALEKEINIKNYEQIFTQYIPINTTNLKINNKIIEYKKNGFIFYFFDRSNEFGIPVLECLLFNKNYFSIIPIKEGFDDLLIRRIFIVEDNIEKAICKAINKILNSVDFNIINSAKLDIELSNTVEPTDFSWLNQIINDLNFEIIENNNFVVKVSDKIEDIASSYEEYLESMAMGTYLPKDLKVIISPMLLKNLPRNNLNINLLSEYLIIMTILKTKRIDIMHEKIMTSLCNSTFCNYDLNNENKFISLLIFILSHLSAGKSFMEIKEISKDIYSKEMFDCAINLINNNKNLFDNPYLFVLEDSN